MAKSDKRTETLVGFFLFVGMTLLGVLIVKFGQFKDKPKESYTITVEFKDASGVIKGSEVRLGGAKIGQVLEKPELGQNRKVKVVMAIREDLLLPSNTVFQIASLSLLGDKAIIVTIPDQPDPAVLGEGAFVQGGGPSGLEAIQGDAESIAADARVLMGNARTSLQKIDASLDEVLAVAVRLGDSVERINNGLLSDENVESFTAAMANFEKATANIQDASGDLKPVLADTKRTLESVASAAEEAEQTFAKAGEQLKHLEPALREVPRAVHNIARVVDKAGNAMDRLDSGEGLLGTLAYDREVKTDTKTFVKNLRRHGILGYRDAEEFDENDPRERLRGRRR